MPAPIPISGLRPMIAIFKDIFAVESEVAQEIADSLKAKLSPAEANTARAGADERHRRLMIFFFKGEFEQRVAHSNFRSESYDQAERMVRGSNCARPEFRPGHRTIG